MTPRQKIAGIYAVVVFISAILAVLIMKWDLPELTGMFLVMGVGAGLIAGMSVRNICVAIADGCKDVMLGAIYICLARAAYVLMTEGKIIDTIVHGLSNVLSGLPSGLTVIGILIIVTVLNFFVSSGSGKAVMLFPILAPLADLCGITRQTVVWAYQFGDGLSNMFWPTNGTQGACLGIAGIPWNKWAKFYFPLLSIWCVVAAAFLVFAQAIHFGPF
ncbi:AbgT family transporter [uncultured Dysosmobacter sp.]|uniref:AbgT family transporter n=1 Tax=uncultured Dysosmobacter sp. TaxID=2591384 RepID=UPI0026337201|nr:AbgT family transporter [uncultured Dysosmobacter sp.]